MPHDTELAGDRAEITRAHHFSSPWSDPSSQESLRRNHSLLKPAITSENYEFSHFTGGEVLGTIA